MKKDIHPTYYEKAVVTCSCGAKHIVGSTREKMTVEICSECHPFYTGKEKLVDTAGRVEKFKSRQKRAEASVAHKKSKTDKKTEKANPKRTSVKKPASPKATAKKKATTKKTTDKKAASGKKSSK